jgi:hypothetical protein
MPVNNPPGTFFPAEQVRHPQRRLAHFGGVVEPASAALDVNRIRDVLINALSRFSRSSQPSDNRAAAQSRRDPTAAQRCS